MTGLISPDMLITPHFRYHETWCHPNEKARKDGFPESIPYPEEWIDDRLIVLLGQLEIIRAHFDMPIKLDSVYRSVDYNDFLYTSQGQTPTNSQHCFGRAADIVVVGVAPKVVHDAIFQLYNEHALHIGGLGSYPNFTHIDTRPLGTHLAQWTGGRTGN